MPLNSSRFRLLLVGVALTALASLIIELALTRLFSVLLFYHFAFMAISVALLGMGAGGLCSYWVVGDGDLETLWTRFSALAGANALVTVAALAVILQMRVSLTVTLATLAPLVVIYFASALPFFFTGVILSVLLARTVDNAGAVYFADLAGASAGALLLIPLLDWLGGPNTLLFAALLSSASAVVWAKLGGAEWRQWAALPALLAILIAANAQFRFLDVRYAKGQQLRREVFSHWNSFSRVALVEEPDGPYIRIDSDAATHVADVPLSDGKFWRARSEFGTDLVHQIMRQVHPGASTLVIGPGGGPDVANALFAGSRSVTGVEINPIIVNEIMLKRALDLSYGLYQRPDVRIVIEDGRSFIRRSSARYGVIQATLVDTWASTAAGAFALTENNLYTVEAFREYLRHLDSDGILSITRWEFRQPREALRLVSLGIEALREEGVSDPRGHFLIVADGNLSDLGNSATFLMKRSPFSADELEAVRVVMRGSRWMTPLYMPNATLDTPFDRLVRAPDPLSFEQAYPFDITPVHDNRPFFFFTVRTRDLVRLWLAKESMDQKVNLGLLMLLGLLAVSGIGIVLFLLLPARLSARLPRAPGVHRWLFFFTAIGLAYILVEIAFIQKFVLFLGHPTYALTVAVFWLLAASGCGSYWTRRFGDDAIAKRLPPLLVATAIIVGAQAMFVTPLLTALVSWPLAGRIGVAALLLAPAGFLMGTAFPTGMRLARRVHPGVLQWAWAMNAATSVLGSALSVFLSIHLGIWQTMAAGAGCYLLAAGLALKEK